MCSSGWVCVSKTDVGNVRKINEDSYLSSSNVGLWCVADGMGGHAKGDVASGLIIERLSALVEQSGDAVKLEQILTCIKAVNNTLISMSKKHDSIVGSTVAVLFIHAEKIYCVWAGDSRIYRVRDRQISRLTRDHSQVEDMIDAGLISADEAENHPKANIITRAVGAHEELQLEVATYDLDQNDQFMLCSDGLNKVMTDKELESFILNGDFSSLADDLVKHAILKNARDNVTVILVQNENFNGNLLRRTLPLDATLPLSPR